MGLFWIIKYLREIIRKMKPKMGLFFMYIWVFSREKNLKKKLGKFSYVFLVIWKECFSVGNTLFLFVGSVEFAWV